MYPSNRLVTWLICEESWPAVLSVLCWPMLGVHAWVVCAESASFSTTCSSFVSWGVKGSNHFTSREEYVVKTANLRYAWETRTIRPPLTQVCVYTGVTRPVCDDWGTVCTQEANLTQDYFASRRRWCSSSSLLCPPHYNDHRDSRWVQSFSKRKKNKTWLRELE